MNIMIVKPAILSGEKAMDLYEVTTLKSENYYLILI